MNSTTATRNRPVRAWRATVAAALATVLAIAGIHSPAFAAATSDGVTLTIDYGSQSYDGYPVVETGTSYTARLQYSVPDLTPGASVVIEVPDGITVPAGALVVPGGNTIVDTLELNGDGDVVMTFKDPLDNSIDQGVIAFDFVFDARPGGSGIETVTWRLEGVEDSLTIIVREPGDQFRPDLNDTEGKSVGGANLNSFVTRDALGDVTLDPTVVDAEIPYTIRIESDTARTGVTITDVISDYLQHDAASVVATLVTWDADGLNRTEAPFTLPAADVTGDTMTIGAFNLPAQSVLEIRYDASVIPGRVAALEAALQTQADAVDEESGGNYAVVFGNDAVIDGSVGSNASIGIGGYIAPAPTPNLGAAFAKTVTPTGSFEIEVDGDGELVTPIDVTYRLRANLTQFAGFEGTQHELTRNVVITDTLPASIEWASPAFISDNGIGLVAADGTCLAAGDFSDDSCVGQYQVIDAGKTLMINVGGDTAANHLIDAQAVITSVEGLTAVNEPGNQPQVQTRYTVTNAADFDYSDTRTPYRRSASNTLLVPKAPGSVINDPSEFTKTTESPIVLRPGESADVPYTFTLAAGAVPDLASTRLIDEVDTTVFDVSDLGVIQDSITGTYDYQGTLSGSDFDVVLSGDDLVFTPSSTFGADLPGSVDLTGALTDRLQFSFDLPTHVIQGKQTLEVSNTARVEGDDEDAYEWVSEARGSATTYGDELEVSKLLYAGDDTWTRNLRVELDSEGEMVSASFIYRVELIPHGNYSGVSIIPLEDTLPAGTTFEGFVTDAQLEAGDVTGSNTQAMGGNVRATWVEADNTVEIEQMEGTTLPAGASVAVNFKVQVTDFTEDVSITNSIGNASATITPSNGYPLMVLKQDSERPTVSITDRNARFTVTGPDGVITDEAYVVGGQLMVAGDGGDTAIVVPEDPDAVDGIPAGQYTITETMPPAGYALADEPVVVTIDDEGGSNSVTLFNDPLPLYAIGDLVWIDADNDGLQGPEEAVLDGVTVELVDADTGVVLRTTTTNADGRYLFDLLPEGEYRVRFTLTEEQAKMWTLTTPHMGEDGTVESDADRATGETGVIALGETNTAVIPGPSYPHGDVQAFLGVDPTWDAGVVLRPGTVAVGDYVWIDEDRDGRQDEGEPGIPGVTLVLTGPDGEPVIDVDGRTVQPQVTDRDGRYLFTDLPVLEEGQSYTVAIDREASADALAEFDITLPGEGDRGGDSSSWTASSEGLTEAGEFDLTLDFGFVRPESSEPGEPTGPSESGGVLSSTGVQATGAVLLSALLIMAGAFVLAWRRRVNG
ncbi:SdrD B-like domain-containing protein [Demequina aestuarii]|uniref:SdrD B-like domain-containing protein n=1 Tax=Demequina aestuarii TaxID=327095 RepID=UPI0007803E10|nr:SdrD B-like domain-containing protein [Demequina aestuarii]